MPKPCFRPLLASGLASLFVLAAGSPAAARDGGGPGRLGRRFDGQRVVAVAGMVLGLDRGGPWHEGRAGARMALRTATGEVAVYLGPAWLIEGLTPAIAAGEDVVVEGAPVDFGEGPALSAAVVRRGERRVTLRDAKGWPVWQGLSGRPEAR